MAEAYRYFQNCEYLCVAKESGEWYYRNWLSKGYTTGGPGEILQGVDSESEFGRLGIKTVGGIFNGSCWSETSNLLALAETIPLLAEE